MAAVPNGSDPGLLTSLARLSKSLLAHARMRLQLMGLELQQEKERLFVALIATLVAFLFLAITLVLVALAVVAHFWDTPDRIASIVWMAVIAAAATIGSGVFAFVRFTSSSGLFKASLAELVSDEESFESVAVDPLGEPMAGDLHDHA